MRVTFVALPLILFAFVLLLTIVVVLVAYAGRGRSQSGLPQPKGVISSPVDRQARLEILRQLADRQITVEQAEVRLATLGAPLPAEVAMGRPPDSQLPGCLLGGLIALIVAGLAVLVLSLLFYVASYAPPRLGIRQGESHPSVTPFEPPAQEIADAPDRQPDPPAYERSPSTEEETTP